MHFAFLYSLHGAFQASDGSSQCQYLIQHLFEGQGHKMDVFSIRQHLLNVPNFMRRQAAERTAINAPMQGSAADIIKRAMLRVDAWLRTEQLQSRMIMQVHDELVLEVPESELDTVTKGICEEMSAAAELSVPLLVEAGIGKNWDEAH